MKKREWSGKTVLVGVTGSIAAYKAAELVSTLRQRGANVYVLMTSSAKEFVGPLTFKALSGNEVIGRVLQELPGMNPSHIRLAEKADLMIVAPATAHILAKFHYGLADDILSCVYLALKAPTLIAPAMNSMMYEHPAVKENIDALVKRGVLFVEPDTGFLACGYDGPGRLAPVQQILEVAEGIVKRENISYSRSNV